jgi:hypothetical protein
VIALCAVLRTATGVASPLWLAGTATDAELTGS